jgi:transcription elongation factor GreA
VSVEDLDSGETLEWQILHEASSDRLPSTVSSESPIGRALLGHLVGETVAVELPRGTRHLRINATD